MDPEAKNLLLEIFAALGFSEEEKTKALLDFEKKVATDLLDLYRPELPKDQQEFLAKEGATVTDPRNSMVIAIRNSLKNLHSNDEYRGKIKIIFRELLNKYLEYMGSNFGEEKLTYFKQRAGSL